ncbi:MAG TPA: hypothetical protein VLB44_27680 [Kofleriaceae bacterium]|nr:hypothetical protein [Kofleriaceae bacterium]
MKLITVAVMAALAMTGCSKKSDKGSTAGGASCGDAISKAVGAMPGGGGEVQAKLQQILTTRCTEDKWSAEVINCYATQASDMASMKKCREMLPPDEQQKVMGEIRAVMMSAGGGGPMHPGGGGPMMGGPGGAPPAGGAAPPAGSAQ